MSLVDCRMGCAGEKLFQIEEQHSAGPPVSAEVPMKLLLEPMVGEMQPHSAPAGPVVIYHVRGVERYQNVVALGLVDLSVGNVRGVDGPDLPTFLENEVAAFLRLPRPVQHLAPAGGRAGKEVKLEVLGALLPTNAVAALLPVIEHGSVGEGFLQCADSGVPGLQSCLPPCPAASVSRLAALLACHNRVFAFRTDTM